jgi:hypothetical protein
MVAFRPLEDIRNNEGVYRAHLRGWTGRAALLTGKCPASDSHPWSRIEAKLNNIKRKIRFDQFDLCGLPAEEVLFLRRQVNELPS